MQGVARSPVPSVAVATAETEVVLAQPRARGTERLGAALAETDQVFYYVYVLQSVNQPEHFYVGYTNDLKLRLAEHNSGTCRHTNVFRPWKIYAYFAVGTKEKAEQLELYLKSHAGRNFQKKYL